jgi:uncharacterized protein (DUF4415 family)
MKSDATSKKLPADFPASSAAWQHLIDAAPKKVPRSRKADAYNPNDAKSVRTFWKDAVVVQAGGPAAVRAALRAKRKPGERGPQKAPTKKLVSLRLSPEVLEHFKAKGPGWQTRIDETLKAAIHRAK